MKKTHVYVIYKFIFLQTLGCILATGSPALHQQSLATATLLLSFDNKKKSREDGGDKEMGKDDQARTTRKGEATDWRLVERTPGL